ncbi:unnamed protein product [Zymoseptoria tritici ST99CH_3D7]|uniref:Uncharacterized protein n=2 Tax=Zymoseptoria tritici TaxID=1047171 RepID=A0A1X7S910_ZYMT9|nr:unnamed protein product [Zymoseptoria tritici ST99CH_3D7]SMR62002.1 unnamed protein product [Zymoseptoria tritici ST99CH_1E4]
MHFSKYTIFLALASLLPVAFAVCKKPDTTIDKDPTHAWGSCIEYYPGGEIFGYCNEQNPCQDTTKPCKLSKDGRTFDCPMYPP